ncbi:MAG: hypothetical protein OSA77_02610 [Halioglobus sp.]|nr:hypothetical protein [Halioglobus sp.]
MRKRKVIGGVINAQGQAPSRMRYRLIDSGKSVHPLNPISRNKNHPASVNAPIRVI